MQPQRIIKLDLEIIFRVVSLSTNKVYNDINCRFLRGKGLMFWANRALSALKLALSFLLVNLLWSQVNVALAQSNRLGIFAKSLKTQDSDHTYQFNLSSEIKELIQNSADTDLYDPITIANLRQLKELAEPRWNEDDIDPDRTRRVVQKALAIETARTIIPAIRRSDLGPVLTMFERGLSNFEGLFRYSVQDTGKSFVVSKGSKGEKLIELSPKFSLAKGLDPQLKVGRSFRVRWDYLHSGAMLEYGVDF